ncbi:MAG: NIPSNAP family protein [Gemmataceae bacterium]
MRRMLYTMTGLMALAAVGQAAEPDSRIFELRTIVPNPGKMGALHARFKDHVMKLYEKHGATNLGYFVPADGKTEKIFYVLAFKDLESRNQTMDRFAADPVWKKVAAESEKNGALVKDVNYVLTIATPYSPIWKAKAEKPSRVFELRTYTAPLGKLEKLNERFQDHTMKLFSKHGMTNVAYWNVADLPQQDTNKLSKDTTLVYLLAHKSADAMNQSFAAFRNDPVWIKAKGESEKKGSLTVPDGVKSELFKPTEYSPTK